jgi:hypothetical protein
MHLLDGSNTAELLSKIMEAESEISYVQESGFEQKFNGNGVFVVDVPQTQLHMSTKAREFFEEHGIKHAFIYKMQDMPCEGYIAFYNTRDLSRKYPQPDITDFTYLSKMIEIALKSR